MPNPRQYATDPRRVEIVHRLYRDRYSRQTIYDELQKAGLPTSTGTIGNIIAQIINEPSEPTKQEAKTGGDMKIPQQHLDDMRQAAQALNDWEEPVEETWKRAEERNNRAIRKALHQSEFSFRVPERHCFLSFISDMHISLDATCDLKRMREDAEHIRNTPGCYCVLGGDQVDNHIKHRSAVLASRSTPSDQYLLLEYYLDILGPKCLLMVSGNHDDWTTQTAGVDVLSRIARDKRIFYAPDEAFLRLAVGSQTYLIGMRHQYRMNSSFNQTHACKQWLRNGSREWDIGAIGHHHETAIEEFEYRGQMRWACRPGSYQITSAYSRQLGYNAATPTTPTFLLHGDERRIDGFTWVQRATTIAQKLREIA